MKHFKLFEQFCTDLFLNESIEDEIKEFRKLIREDIRNSLKENGYGSNDPRSLQDIEAKLAELMDFSLSGYDRKVANEINLLASIYKNKGGKKTLKAIAKENS